MKAVRLHGPNDLRVDDIAMPAAGLDDVVVRVAAVGICGSDIGYVRAGGVAGPVTSPIGLGHELAGTIETVGANVTGLTPGMRVVVNPMGSGNAIGNGSEEGAFAPFLLVRNAQLGDSILAIADDVPFHQAALVEPLAVALHAVNRADVTAQSQVAVFGAGPIGLGLILLLKQRGVASVVAIDMSDSRLARASALGADRVINPAHEDVTEALSQAHGAQNIHGWPVVGTDVFFEASGGKGVIPSIINMAPFHGRLIIVAVHHDDVPVNFQMALGKELSIITSMAYPDEFPDVLEIISRPDTDLGPMISHRFAFNDFAEAYEVAQNRDLSAKVILEFADISNES